MLKNLPPEIELLLGGNDDTYIIAEQPELFFIIERNNDIVNGTKLGD